MRVCFSDNVDIINHIISMSDNNVKHNISQLPEYKDNEYDITYITDKFNIKKSFYGQYLHSFYDKPAMIIHHMDLVESSLLLQKLCSSLEYTFTKKYGTELWYNMGNVHRIGKPAIIKYRGNLPHKIMYCRNGDLYRPHGPHTTKIICYNDNIYIPDYAKRKHITKYKEYVDNFDILCDHYYKDDELKELNGTSDVNRKIIHITYKYTDKTVYVYHVIDNNKFCTYRIVKKFNKRQLVKVKKHRSRIITRFLNDIDFIFRDGISTEYFEYLTTSIVKCTIENFGIVTLEYNDDYCTFTCDCKGEKIIASEELSNIKFIRCINGVYINDQTYNCVVVDIDSDKVLGIFMENITLKTLIDDPSRKLMRCRGNTNNNYFDMFNGLPSIKLGDNNYIWKIDNDIIYKN